MWVLSIRQLVLVAFYSLFLTILVWHAWISFWDYKPRVLHRNLQNKGALSPPNALVYVPSICWLSSTIHSGFILSCMWYETSRNIELYFILYRWLEHQSKICHLSFKKRCRFCDLMRNFLRKFMHFIMHRLDNNA